MRKYGESKTTRIMMATVPHVISGLGLRKFQADGFLLTRVYLSHFLRSERSAVASSWPPEVPRFYTLRESSAIDGIAALSCHRPHIHLTRMEEMDAQDRRLQLVKLILKTKHCRKQCCTINIMMWCPELLHVRKLNTLHHHSALFHGLWTSIILHIYCFIPIRNHL